jgi:hypothetical protein
VPIMKFTRYFLYTRQRNDRKDIKLEWIQNVIDHPVREEIQTDGRVRRWAKISEANDKYLRVILLEDGETVHNAFFDGGFRENA